MWDSVYKKFTPVQLLNFGFVLIIIFGALLLMLPISSSESLSQNFLDALFTSTSAVTTTGLIVVDTGTYYSLFGQSIILILIQIGGLGYMIFFALIYIAMKDKLSITGKKFLRESLVRTDKIEMIKFVKVIILFTFLIELTGVIVFFFYWLQYFPFAEALSQSVFHSISAFCTAGFSLFPDSLSSYGTSAAVNINTFILAITGSIGFFVLYDIYFAFKQKIRKNKISNLTLHSKVVFIVTLILFLSGTVFLFIFEGNKFSSSFFEKFIYALFQTITASTTVGFNTVDIGLLSTPSLFIIIILMFIGGSPGSTAGGIKTTSLAAILLLTKSVLRGRTDITILRRKLSSKLNNYAVAIIVVASISITIGVLILTITENHNFIKILFEAISAFGTIGLSTGITFGLTAVGKIVIIFLMFIGRIGSLAIGLSLIGNTERKEYSFPEEDILIV